MQAFLTKVQIAERFGTTPGVAAAILSEKGVLPIDLGRGRGKGLRWYSQAVEIVLRQMHDEAQAKVVRKPVRLPRCGLVQGRSANELYAELTGSGKLQ